MFHNRGLGICSVGLYSFLLFFFVLYLLDLSNVLICIKIFLFSSFRLATHLKCFGVFVF